MVNNKFFQFQEKLTSLNNNETDFQINLKDLFNLEVKIFVTSDTNNFSDNAQNFVRGQIIWDEFDFYHESNFSENEDSILKEICFKKSFINFNKNNFDKINNNKDLKILKNLKSVSKNLTNNGINHFNRPNTVKYLRLNFKFDIIKLQTIEKLLFKFNNILIDQKNKLNINDNKKLIEDHFESNNNNNKIYVCLLDYFITFAKKVFIINNHINFKIYFNHDKYIDETADKVIDYRLIYEESFDNIAKIEFFDLENFLSHYWKIEKENIYKTKGEYISFILSFCEYKTLRKNECNNLEILFLDSQRKNLIMGEEYLNFYFNFIEENAYFKNYFAQFDIILEDPKTFLNKINANNPFKREITSNFIESNQIDLNFIYEAKFKYVFF